MGRNRQKSSDLVNRALGELFAMALGELGVSRKHVRVAGQILGITDGIGSPKVVKQINQPAPIHVAKGVDYFPPTVKPVTK